MTAAASSHDRPRRSDRQGNGAVHRAGIEIVEPEAVRDASRNRPLPRCGRPVNRDNHGMQRMGLDTVKIAGPRPLEQAGVRVWRLIEADHLIRNVTVSFSLIALLVDAAPDWSNW